jgi:hypothetical protein
MARSSKVKIKEAGYGTDKKEVPYTLAKLSQAVVGEYSVLIYELASGDPMDPASTVERRLATYQGKVPPKPFDEPKSSYYGEFERLRDAKLDERLEIVQEGDYTAQQHREATRSLLQVKKGHAYVYGAQVTYQEFMDAIERVANDDTDEEAWGVIDQWRRRQLRSEER